MTKKPKHDKLFKRIMSNEIAAKEFLEYYLPSNFKEKNAPMNLWELFVDPVQAKELMVSDYHLVDLQSMSNDEINKKKHLGMFEI